MVNFLSLHANKIDPQEVSVKKFQSLLLCTATQEIKELEEPGNIRITIQYLLKVSKYESESIRVY